MIKYLVYKPGRQIVKFIFYKVVVKFYGLYFSIMKRIGWEGVKENIFAFLFYKKLVHIMVLLVSFTLIFLNITNETQAGDISSRANKTILADLVKSEFSEFEEDERLVLETFDMEAVISETQQNYLDNLSSVRPQRIAGTNEDLTNSGRIITQKGTSIVGQEVARTVRSKKKREEAIEYTVLPGDTISTIAQNFEISVSTILWENDLSAYSIIRPGDKLTILPSSGINYKVQTGDNLSRIAKKYDVEEKDILDANEIKISSELKIGQKIFIPGGKKVIVQTPRPKTYTGFTAIKEIVKAPSAKPVAGNMMNWPTEGKRITQYYSWRHTGLDIANKLGTPLYAADAGVVEVAGWGTGYGNQIVINHGGGKKTRYAHASQLYVKKGDTVTKGQTIAAMGSTGWSTGPHIHFEVIINGVKYNPLNYIQ